MAASGSKVTTCQRPAIKGLDTTLKPIVDAARYADFAAGLGFKFSDPSLLQRALTHRSYINEHPDEKFEDNERLEFLGDSILDFIAAEWLYERFPEMSEGNLTRLRAGLVRNEALADYTRAIGLNQMLLLGKGEEESGGRDRLRNLGGAFEAFAGAIYLDQGIDAVRAFAKPLFAPILDEMIRAQSDKDAKSRLQEWSQSVLNLTPVYRTVRVTGPDHERDYTLEVVIGDKVYGVGNGRNKQVAAQAAAQAALEAIMTQQ
jgi:ribonuclease III